MTVALAAPANDQGYVPPFVLIENLRLPRCETFAEWRDGEGGRILRAMGYNISGMASWSEFRAALQAENAATERAVVAEAKRLRARVPADAILIDAAMTAAGFGWLPGIRGYDIAVEAHNQPAPIRHAINAALKSIPAED